MIGARVTAGDRVPWVALIAAFALLGASAPAAAQKAFYNFESGHVRPLAFWKAGLPTPLLFAVNTPDNRLSIFEITSNGGLGRRFEVPVGLEPVAVAVRLLPSAGGSGGGSGTGGATVIRPQLEAWVVNHLSDSVSIVRLDAANPGTAAVERTILLCDEPRDIVFAGIVHKRAFISAARRGQNCSTPADLTQEGVGRALVQVIELAQTSDALDGGARNVVLMGDTPRALATDPNGEMVFAAVFLSGNKTTSIGEPLVTAFPNDAHSPPFQPPTPIGTIPSTLATALIARQDEFGFFRDVAWSSSIGPDEDPRQLFLRDWNQEVAFELPDFDVFQIDPDSDPEAGPAKAFSGAGSVLFNLAVRLPLPGETITPCIGFRSTCPRVYVSNLEASNEVRFEPILQGHATDNRISVLPFAAPSDQVGAGGPGFTVAPVRINRELPLGHFVGKPGIEHGRHGWHAFTLTPSGLKPKIYDARKSTAFPMGMEFSSDFKKLYVAGFGSGKVAVFDVAALDQAAQSGQGAPAPTFLNTGAGPTGLAVDSETNRLYVMNRIDQTISVIDTVSKARIGPDVAVGYDPTPDSVRNGRRFLYDAQNSAHGDQACASCHIFGDLDGLAWDLGDPYASQEPAAMPPNPNAFREPDRPVGGSVAGFDPRFHPMKGPMTTQSLRGMVDRGPMHWRGDRTGGLDEQNQNRLANGDPMNTCDAFRRFNGAFAGLLGGAKLSPADLNAFASFALTLDYPPSPIRQLDGALRAGSETGGEVRFDEVPSTGALGCTSCHKKATGGTDGFSSVEGGRFGADDLLPQEMKIPHLRNLYQKVGMFGVPDLPGVPGGATKTGPLGPQVRGFGFLHDGSVPTVFDFMQAVFLTNSSVSREFESFLLTFDTGLAPAVGQQVTVTAANKAVQPIADRLDLLIARDEAGACELVAKGILDAGPRGLVYDDLTDNFATDDPLKPMLSKSAILSDPKLKLTFTCAPPGTGRRMGINRDGDDLLDGEDATSTGPIEATALCP
jgi:DNA-binding beta-propeller fold protein YncE